MNEQEGLLPPASYSSPLQLAPTELLARQHPVPVLFLSPSQSPSPFPPARTLSASPAGDVPRLQAALSRLWPGTPAHPAAGS